jgi:hypothetical protein
MSADEPERREAGDRDDQPASPEGGLGILFLGAAVGLALILSVVGAVAYFALSR